MLNFYARDIVSGYHALFQLRRDRSWKRELMSEIRIGTWFEHTKMRPGYPRPRTCLFPSSLFHSFTTEPSDHRHHHQRPSRMNQVFPPILILISASISPSQAAALPPSPAPTTPVLDSTQAATAIDGARNWASFIATGISHTRDTYLGAELISVEVKRNPGAPLPTYSLALLWESPDAQWIDVQTDTKIAPSPSSPDSSTEHTIEWDSPEEGIERIYRPQYFTFDWEDVVGHMELDEAFSLMRGAGFELPYRRILVSRPLIRPWGATSRLFYQFEMGDGGRVFVGVQEGEVTSMTAPRKGR